MQWIVVVHVTVLGGENGKERKKEVKNRELLTQEPRLASNPSALNWFLALIHNARLKARAAVAARNARNDRQTKAGTGI